MCETSHDGVGGAGWATPGGGDVADEPQDKVGLGVGLVEDEDVGVLRGDAVLSEGVVGEVAQVGGDENVGAGVDGGGQDVKVVGVGKCQVVDVVFVVVDTPVTDGLAHEGAGAVELGVVEVGTVAAQAGEDLVEDGVCPDFC